MPSLGICSSGSRRACCFDNSAYIIYNYVFLAKHYSGPVAARAVGVLSHISTYIGWGLGQVLVVAGALTVQTPTVGTSYKYLCNDRGHLQTYMCKWGPGPRARARANCGHASSCRALAFSMYPLASGSHQKYVHNSRGC